MTILYSRSRRFREYRISKSLLASLAVLVAVFFSYGEALEGEFVWDDHLTILRNPSIRNPLNLKAFFTSDYLESWYSEYGWERSFSYIRPITLFTFSIDYLAGGLSPFPYHLTNIGIHAGTSLLLLAVAKLIFGDIFIALFSAIFFSSLPVLVEDVAWASSRADILCGLFFALSFYLFLKGVLEGRKGILALTCFTFALSLFSKEMSLTFPLICLIFLVTGGAGIMNQGSKGKGAYLSTIPLFVIGGLYFVLRSFLLPGSPVTIPILREPAPYSLVVFKSYGLYLKSLIYPLEPKPFIGVRVVPEITDPLVISGILFLSMTIILTLFRPKASFFPLFILVSLIPVSNIIPIPIATFVAERYLYIPALPFSLLMASLLMRVLGREREGVRGRIATLLVTGFVFFLFLPSVKEGVRIWGREDSLFQRMLESSHPKAGYPHLFRGKFLFNQGRFEEAFLELETAAKLSSHDERSPLFQEAVLSMGSILENQGRYEEAEKVFRKVMNISPENIKAMQNLLSLLIWRGRLEEAGSLGRILMESRPRLASINYNMGILNMKMLEFGKAKSFIQRAAILDGTDSYSRLLKRLDYLESILLKRGDPLTRGKVAMKVGSWSMAVPLLQSHLQERSGDMEAGILLVKSLILGGEEEGAEEVSMTLFPGEAWDDVRERALSCPIELE